MISYHLGCWQGKFQTSQELMSPPAAVSTTEAVRSTFFLDPRVGAASAGGNFSLLSEASFLLSAGACTSLGRPDVPRVQAGLDGAESLGTHAAQHNSVLTPLLKSTLRRAKLSVAGRLQTRLHYAVSYVSLLSSWSRSLSKFSPTMRMLYLQEFFC